MARGKQPTNDERIALIEALKFAATATKLDDNSGLSQYVTIRAGWLMAENDTFCIGVPVKTELELCFHSEKFLAALQQCSANFQMVQLSKNELSIKSGAFRAVIPVLPADSIVSFGPDMQCGVVTDALLAGIKAVAKGCTGKGNRVIDETILLRSNTVVATNGAFALEYWHGISLPEPMAIPKRTVDMLIKSDKPLSGFGCNMGASLTLYFVDGAFVKTRLHATPWPTNLDALFAQHFTNAKFAPIWKGFADAIKALDKFIENDCICFHSGTLSTGENLEHAAASYAIEGLPPGYKYSPAYWRICLPFAEQIWLNGKDNPLAFMSGNCRGLLMGKN